MGKKKIHFMYAKTLKLIHGIVYVLDSTVDERIDSKLDIHLSVLFYLIQKYDTCFVCQPKHIHPFNT